ncbi:hypothetical protein DBR32_13185 [Taibaiella sp. KBW10]|uniref:OmpH family outer membrane protein n=1 Tax=Taibaiella sp. KBW10 TaxID=2153357 RepID=UPI000F5B102B|nr:OmpH family outer membrane protein [Taibaiella sp. KBW10]RQO30512.1 hypothetical protein DBR32_13185 [Taibaiella sp. KBW10]
MNKVNTTFSSLAILLGTILLLAACGNKKGNTEKAATATETKTGTVSGVKLAYVNGDTLNANYIFLKEKKASYERKQAAFEAEMAQKEKALQTEYIAFQKKAQAGTVTEAEGAATQKRLGQQQQALEQRHQTISAQLLKEQSAIQEEFQNNLDAFLEQYNKEKKYDFIFTYSKAGGQILYANQALDITKEVLDAMNAAGGAPKEPTNPLMKATADTTKK